MINQDITKPKNTPRKHSEGVMETGDGFARDVRLACIRVGQIVCDGDDQF